jgi:predicted Zn-dependent protease
MSGWIRCAVIGLATGVVLGACAKVPYTGRLQGNIVPNGIMRSIGKTTYATMLSGKKLQKKGANATTLSRVGGRVATVANQPKYDWSYTLIVEDTLNAWCLPGGYIGFYTGILPALESEAGMASVMGHEVGHAMAHHGAERLSQSLALLGGLLGLKVYLDKETKMSQKDQALVLGAVGVGATFGIILPFSRAHEREADVIGMMYMAEAGYPPVEAVNVWKRMDKLGGASVPAFMSTHPSHKARQANLKEWLPAARKKYQRSKRYKGVLNERW